MPFINKVFADKKYENHISYKFIKFYSNKNKELDLNNYRYFCVLVLQIEAFIEIMNGKISDKIISYILLGGYFNYLEFRGI